MLRRHTISFFRIAIFATLMILAGQSPANEVQFNRDVRGILSENCFFCHGPDSAKREADLRLDDEDAAKQSAIVAGDSMASELIARILSTDPDTRMPPPETGRVVSAKQIEILKRWIDEGAKYEPHWSFIAPTRPSVPEDSTGWSRQSIDNFVLQKMRASGLTPAKEADRASWLRRVTYDLTGLPPTIDELDAFENDAAPYAYEKVVDRLLASPTYGERMTADWLDVARYSDSYGMQVDKDRRVFPYRDWLIDSFNRGMPYDQFLTEQIAGDLLPGASREQILATTFNRLHPQECEGGSVPEEFRIESVADRTQTVATAFLGLTMECCRCHDHKYDPISQKDYYSLSSFFDNIDEAGLYSYFTESCPTPTLELPTPEQEAALANARQRVRELESDFEALVETRHDDFERWAIDVMQNDRPWLSSSDPASVYTNDFESFTSPVVETAEGKIGKHAAKFSGDDGLEIGVGNFDRWQPFSISCWINTPDRKDRAVVYHRSRAWTDAASRGYELLIDEGHLQASLIHFWPGNAVSIRAVDPLPIQQWVHVVFASDGTGLASGLTMFVDGEKAPVEIIRDSLTKQITGGGGDQITIGARFRDRGFAGGRVDQFTIFNREVSSLEAAALHDPAVCLDQKNVDSKFLRDQLREHFVKAIDPVFAQNQQLINEARKAVCQIEDSIAEIMVMKEMPKRRPSHLLARGAYDAKEALVTPAVPESLPELPKDAPENRLGLASWMCADDNPLVSRVAVNRLWQILFSRGLVSTPEDFGSQGMAPSHPEVLDYLAIEYRESGWETKAMLKRIVLSSTYRQASLSPDPRDPENILLSRAPRYRLTAEMLRDAVLAISGLLDTTIGGEPARPYEVEVSFKPVTRDQGKGLYRRSLYTYWKRTGPAPMMTALDASLRDVCRVKRDVTASPLQSLVMFNSPQFVEAARVAAENLVREHGQDSKKSMAVLFRQLTGQRPSDEELALIVQLHTRQVARFGEELAMKEDNGASNKVSQLMAIGDSKPATDVDPVLVASTTSVILSLLNLDSTLTKR